MNSSFQVFTRGSRPVSTPAEEHSKTVLLVGPRSSAKLTYGMSIGFDLLISGFAQRGLPYLVIDRTKGMVGRTVGAMSFGGTIATVRMLASYFHKLLYAQIVYLTIGTSRAGFLRDMIMIWSAWVLGRRIVLHLKGGGIADFYEENPAWVRLLLRTTFSRASTIIVLGHLLRRQFDFVANIEQKLKIVPNGLPAELRGTRHKSKSISNDAPLQVLYLSNMIPSKGYLDVLEACRILHFERNIPVHVDFCGAFLQTVNGALDTPGLGHTSAEEFQLYLEAEGLETIAQYHGTVRGETKQAFLQKAHLFMLPTSYPWEGQPISIIEALAFGTPVISTNYRGIPEQVIEQFNGFLVAPHSPAQIADVVERLWHNPQGYQVLSSHAIAHFNARFTQEAHLNLLIPTILGQERAAQESIGQERLVQERLG